MAPNLGITALLLVIFISLFLPIFNFLVYKKTLKFDLAKINNIFLLSTSVIFLLAAFSLLCLIYSYIISDYSILNVYQNSHHLKPLIYKIAGAWGNHEGSMLLLIVIITFYNLAFALINKSEYKFLTLTIQSLIVAGFTLFVISVSNPFALTFNVLNFIPNEGLGLNPLLQDIGLALHPPLLYMGYIGFSLVFSLALSSLLKEKFDYALAKNMEFWLFIPWGFLTIGVALGSWWAYRELGWGGYWFWDPVENVSLMPWIGGLTLIHALKLSGKKESYQIWSIFLAILTFILCLFGVFLVRSGLLTSVHSFAVDAKRGFFIILLISLIGGLSLLIFAFKSHKILTKKHLPQSETTLRQFLLLLNNYILLIGLFTIFLGSLYPILLQSFFDQSISVGANYYNKIFTILLLPFLLFLAMSYFKKLKEITTLRNLIIAIFACLITIAIFFNLEEKNYNHFIILFLSLTIFIISFFSKKNITNISHAGFAILIIGIILSHILSSTKEINVKIGDKISINQNSPYILHFDKIEYAAGKNFLARIGVFTIFKNDKEIAKLRPELRYYPISGQTTNEAAIRHDLLGDLYIVIGNKDEAENYAIRIYHKPFIYLIWLGCIIIFISCIMKVKKLSNLFLSPKEF